MKPYQTDYVDSVKKYDTNINNGLSSIQAHQRLQHDGLNSLPEGKQAGWISIFISQFQNPLIYILLVAAVIIFFVGEQKLDAFIISGILFFNAIIGTIQEGRTSNVVAGLRRFIKAKSVVIRDGAHTIIDDQDLVVGDIIVLKEGERVPADARIFYHERLKVDESILTGESQAVVKNSETFSQELPLGDQKNMVFKGTYIVSGYGKAVVVATGIATEIGKLHKNIIEINTDIPLKRELERLSYFILIFILGMCTGLLVIGLIAGRNFQELLVMLTALFICVVPEGLPVVLTLVLVTGAYRMARQHVLIRNLQGVEALGRTDVIVIDKTGTITRNEMMVTSIYTQENIYEVSGEGYFAQGDIRLVAGSNSADASLQTIGIIGALLNSSELSYSKQLNLFEIKGDPTEAALHILAQKLGYNQHELSQQYRKQYEIPFDSGLKYHAAFFMHDATYEAYVIGAPEVIFAHCATVSPHVKQQLAVMLNDGLRVVALAYKAYDGPAQAGDDAAYKKIVEHDLVLVGLCGIQDAIRPEVAAIIDQARQAGLKVIMATGDHQDTALYVAKLVGIYRANDVVIDGKALALMSDDALDGIISSVTVFSRVSPDDKVRIIKALHKKRYIVAMTGDGVNDVPSLLAADLGIAMGRIGTEVTKQAADLVLLDDSFANIINAITQGRHIFYTLRRIVLYFFATNMGEILIVLFALFTKLPLPLTAAQILWLNLVTDGFLDIGLSMEPQEPDLLQATWLKRKMRLVDGSLLIKMMYLALPMGIVSLCMFSYTYNGTPESLGYARTMTLVTMAMFQWFNAWNCRSEHKLLYQIGLFSNRWLIAATAFVLSLQFGLVYFSFMQFIFKTVPLSVGDWLLIVAVSAPIVLIEEIRKWVRQAFWA
jgi:ATPase, P-type (transporting), HAD superfamily, subfamily IC/ATPase, P-type (transporting), HAD superfamily, subfamily IC